MLTNQKLQNCATKELPQIMGSHHGLATRAGEPLAEAPAVKQFVPQRWR